MVTVTDRLISPSAARLTQSLRDIGYDTSTAIADLVDNSIAAGAKEVHVDFEFDGLASAVVIADDGRGMPVNGLHEAFRFGTRREYSAGELGRFGLGLKTASLSQCRKLTVLSQYRDGSGGVNRRTLDLDLVAKHDEWLIHEGLPSRVVKEREADLQDAPGGTTVVLENLDRILNPKTADSGVGRRRMRHVSTKVAEHLAVVFHRYLAGTAKAGKVTIVVDGEKLNPWDPFAESHEATLRLPEQLFEMSLGAQAHTVALKRFVLPAKNEFARSEDFEALSGPMKWNRQQGIYFYRVDRLVQFGGWSGLRGLDEHTKLARAAVDFSTELDEAFQINVAKMRINLPPEIRKMLEKPIQELCIHAGDRYRRAAGSDRAQSLKKRGGDAALSDVGVALRAAALRTGRLDDLEQTFDLLKSVDPQIYRALNLG